MNILSISGGGVRGLIPLYVLRDIENIHSKPISEIFDYYAGSSIGSIIIAALLISDDGKTPIHSCNELYGMIEHLCKEIFNNSFYHRISTGYGWFGSKYQSDNLERMLMDFFKDRKMQDLIKPVCFPAFDGKSQKPIYFTIETHGDLYLRDVLRATTAAPTYFDPKEMSIINEDMEKKMTLYDSGIVVNNPALVAHIFATRNIDNISKNNIFELCLGTGFCKVPEPTNNGVWGWINSIIGYVFAGFNENEMAQLALCINKDNLMFVNVELEANYDQLDNASDHSLQYYTDTIKKWLETNHDNFHSFVKKVIENLKQ